MQKESVIKIGLLSHMFEDVNLGCVALSICNVKLIDRVAEELGMPIKYIIYVNEKQRQLELNFTETPYEYRVYSSSKQSLKHPIKLLSTKIFADCNVVFNLCAGDGFTDIYGFGRVLSESYMTILGHAKGARVIMSPQTIGPFRTTMTRTIAKRALACCDKIFSRDELSTAFCEELGYADRTQEVIDVAFVLPFEKQEQSHDKTNIGLNVSGLLYHGGYDYNNYFGLSFSYKEYVQRLIEQLLAANYAVHLIAHVVTKDGSIEDDFVVCSELADKYPDVILMPRKESPIDVKSYISGMDVFIGGRMHSTIGAFSAGVPVIPVAYSRKFNGLFNTLEYPYYIDAKGDYNVFSAVDKTMHWIGERESMKQQITRGQQIYTERLQKYVEQLKEYFINNNFGEEA